MVTTVLTIAMVAVLFTVAAQTTTPATHLRVSEKEKYHSAAMGWRGEMTGKEKPKGQSAAELTNSARVSNGEDEFSMEVHIKKANVPWYFHLQTEKNVDVGVKWREGGGYEYFTCNKNWHNKISHTYTDTGRYKITVWNTHPEYVTITGLWALGKDTILVDGDTCLKEEVGVVTSLDVKSLTVLRTLEVGFNQLDSLDVSHNTKLQGLGFSYNRSLNVDISNNTGLQELYCVGNQLTKLDVSNNTSLTLLSCYDNQLTDLDLSKNTKLETLNAFYNRLPFSQLYPILQNRPTKWKTKYWLSPQMDTVCLKINEDFDLRKEKRFGVYVTQWQMECADGSVAPIGTCIENNGVLRFLKKVNINLFCGMRGCRMTKRT